MQTLRTAPPRSLARDLSDALVTALVVTLLASLLWLAIWVLFFDPDNTMSGALFLEDTSAMLAGIVELAARVIR
jgi:hypothetical protein